MSEYGTRKGERAKKLPKYMQQDEADYGIFVGGRAVDQKQKPTNSLQMNQIARILRTFLNKIGQKFQDYHRPENIDRYANDNQNCNESQVKNENLIQKIEQNVFKPSGNSTALVKRGCQTNDHTGGQAKSIKNLTKKAGQSLRSQPTIKSSIQSDLYYHSMLNQHIRNAYPNISSISPQMLKDLDIPRQLLEHRNLSFKVKLKDQRAKITQMLKNVKAGKESKEDQKPFKRQSYHVAIAYHIHLKRIKIANPTQSEIDPTDPARRLRTTQASLAERQQEK